MAEKTTISVYMDDEDGYGLEVEIPGRLEVCGNCDGKGTHVNRNIDGHGIGAEEWNELGPDFQEDYLSGVYDVPCDICHGKRVVLVPDEARCSQEQLKAYEEHLSAKYEMDAEYAAERRMGA